MKAYLKRLTCLTFALFCVLCLFCACTPPAEPIKITTDVRVMSFNIRVGEQTDERRIAVVDNIKQIDPDVFGVQEADHAWITYLLEQLPAYTSVGEGRDGGEKGEYAAIFYRADKYELLQGGTKWLSLTPDAPSILDGGSQYRRIMTYAKLQDKQTGGVFVHLNVHLDFARDEIARQQANILTEFALNFKEYPVFITGDFNQTPDSMTYQQMLDGGFIDSSELAADCHKVATYNGYVANAESHTKLDHCFVSSGNVEISKYDTWDKPAENGGHNGFISDHYAIYVEGTVTNVGEPSLETEKLNGVFFQCGDSIYGDASFASHGMGASCSFADNTLTLTVDKGTTLTLDGIKTGGVVDIRIIGEGSLEIDGNVITNVFETSDSVQVTITGLIVAKEKRLGGNTVLE